MQLQHNPDIIIKDGADMSCEESMFGRWLIYIVDSTPLMVEGSSRLIKYMNLNEMTTKKNCGISMNISVVFFLPF